MRVTLVDSLYTPFRNLTSIYAIASEEVGDYRDPFDVGESLHLLIEENWGVFSEELVENGTDCRLLTAILRSGWDDDSGEAPFDPHELYVWRGTALRSGPCDAWESFKEEVFEDPNAEPELPHDLEIYIERVTIRICAGTELFRGVLGWARRVDGIREPWIVGPPPEGKRVPAGRANREGQRVMYCAEDESTAVAEARPARGNLVSLGPVRVLRDQRVVDLGDSLPIPHPFLSEDAFWQIEETALLNGFSRDLSEPVRWDDDAREYLPSQKLAELIRACNIDGIRYPSAMNQGGKNIVLFDIAAVEPRASRLVEVTDLRVAYLDYKG